ncbi:hypothetical protein LCGC14_1424190 [marine sediment metagenome]|uniref:Uncharacterized protein n=1 Tax=marine sediment metagenome TaxID=412755 RepID=A0A0F9JQX5_9ZZZZ
MALTCHELYGYTLHQWGRLDLETRIHFAAGRYMGWKYGRDVRFAYSSPGIPDKLVAAPGHVWEIDCSSMTTSILTACFPSSPWGSRGYGDMQVYADRLPAQYDSPIIAVENAGIGSRLAQGFEVGRWHLVQGWKKLEPPRGHAFLVRNDGDSMLLVESQFGVGPQWGRTTEAKLRKRYPAALYAAALG